MINEQNEPVLDGSNEAGLEEKIAGFIAQLSADTSGQSPEELAALVSQRFADAGIELDEQTRARVVAEVSAQNS